MTSKEIRPMGTITYLPARLTHTRNLPISWDDEPITWEEWERKPQIILCGVPNTDQACTRCGFNDNHEWSAWGRSQSGRRILQAFRCAGCGHDVVTDTDGEGTWDLDESDYGPLGSHDWTGRQETLL